MYMRIEENLKNQILELRKSGKTYKEIIEITNASKYTIMTICRENGLCKDLVKFTPEQIENFKKLYEELGSITKVSQSTGVSERKLREFIKTKQAQKKEEFCVVCGKKLSGRQVMFCSKECKKEYYKKENNNTSYDSVYSQKKDYHGLYLKYKLILAKGGKCEICGYNKNISALQFHHIDPTTKKFTLDARTIERKKDEEIIEEYNKCQLLCSNCHQEIHHPNYTLDRYKEIKELGSGINYRVPHNLDILGVDE